MNETVGSKLMALRARTNMSLQEIAELCGLKGASSIQRYFSAEFDRPIRGSLALNLTKAMRNRGDPPIQSEEIFELSDVASLSEALNNIGDGHGRGPRFDLIVAPQKENELTIQEEQEIETAELSATGVPIYTSDLLTDFTFKDDSGQDFDAEVTVIDNGDPMGYAPRPAGLTEQRSSHIVFVPGSSMSPRYRPGEPIVIGPKRPPSIGDDVLVQLKDDDGDGSFSICLIKTLVQRSAAGVMLEQYEPRARFFVPKDRITDLSRIIPWGECVAL